MAGPLGTKQRFSERELRGKKLYWLLEFTYASITYRLSREHVEVYDRFHGEWLTYNGGILNEIEWEEGFDLFNYSNEFISVPLQIFLPISVANKVAQGHDLSNAIGELSIFLEGDEYKDRRVVLRGRAVDPIYGGAREPISFSLESNTFEDRGLVPSTTQTITSTTFPLAAEQNFGMSYPFVFGRQPSSATAAGRVTGSKAYMVDATVGAQIVMIAGHEVQATHVTVLQAVAPAVQVVIPVITATDALGATYSAILPNPYFGAVAVDDEYYIIWDQALGGAHWNPSRTDCLEGAGDLIEILLLNSTLQQDIGIDLGRLAASKEKLNLYKFAGAIQESVSPWEYISANILPLLPVSLVTGPEGVYPLFWNYNALPADAVDRWDADNDPYIEREGYVSYENSRKDCVNDFKLKYALSQRVGNLHGAVRLSANRDVNDPYSAENLYCRVSENRYGKRSEEYETTIVYDDATAGLILDWKSRAKCLPQKIVTYLVSKDKAWLERGDIILVTDTELSFDDSLAMINSISFREDDRLSIQLRILEDGARVFHKVGDHLQ